MLESPAECGRPGNSAFTFGSKHTMKNFLSFWPTTTTNTIKSHIVHLHDISNDWHHFNAFCAIEQKLE